MPYVNDPIMVAEPFVFGVNISTANTARDGSGTVGTLVTGTALGVRIDKITVHAKVTTSAGMIRFFLNDGTNKFLVHEEVVAAVTVGADTPAWSAEILQETNPWLAKLTVLTGWTLLVSTHIGEAFSVVAHGGNYGD